MLERTITHVQLLSSGRPCMPPLFPYTGCKDDFFSKALQSEHVTDFESNQAAGTDYVAI